MIVKEENCVKSLINKFDFMDGKCNIARERRIFAEVPAERFADVIGYAANDLKFGLLCTITGLDLGEDLQFIYHIADSNGIVLNLKLSVKKSDPVIRTVTGLFNGAMFYERELESMFGAKVEGLPEGRRYPLPDGWPDGQYPLRKDWKKGVQ